MTTEPSPSAWYLGLAHHALLSMRDAPERVPVNLARSIFEHTMDAIQECIAIEQRGKPA